MIFSASVLARTNFNSNFLRKDEVFVLCLFFLENFEALTDNFKSEFEKWFPFGFLFPSARHLFVCMAVSYNFLFCFPDSYRFASVL